MIKSSTTAGVIQAWPLVGQSTWKKDYAVGFAQADRLTREVGSYFFLNRGWRRWRGLFSHAGVIWSGGSWKVQVWFVGGRVQRRRGGRKLSYRRGRTPRVRIKITRRRRRRQLFRVLGFRRRRIHRRRRQRRKPRPALLPSRKELPGRGDRRRARKAAEAAEVARKVARKAARKAARKVARKPAEAARKPKGKFSLPKGLSYRYRLYRGWRRRCRLGQSLRRQRRRQLPRSVIRRRRQLGKWARVIRMCRHRKRGPLLEMAQLWGAPRGGTWCWIRLARPRYLGVATLLARMKYRLRGRIEMRARRVALPLLRGALRLRGVVGAEVRCHGRFSRRQRASHDVFRAGKLGRTQVSTPREVGFATVPLRFGAVGITLTVSYTSGRAID